MLLLVSCTLIGHHRTEQKASRRHHIAYKRADKLPTLHNVTLIDNVTLLQGIAVHNVHIVDFDSPVSKIAPVSATGLYNVALEI